MCHLLAAFGFEENPSAQFKAIIKNRFRKAFSTKVAACSGNWFYKNLIGLAKCATEYMKSNERYTKASISSGNLKHITVRSISNRPYNFRSFCKPLSNFYNSKPKNKQFNSIRKLGNIRIDQ